MSSYFDIYYWLGSGQEERFTNVTPDPKVVKQRHLVMKQIKLSKLKLRPTDTIPPTYAEVLTAYKKILS